MRTYREGTAKRKAAGLLLGVCLLSPSAAAQADLHPLCDLSAGHCFGLDWKTATVEDMERVSIGAQDPEGVRPLHVACALNENIAVVEALLRRNGDVNVRTKNGLTPMHIAAYSNRNPNIIRLLVQRGGDVRARTDQGVAVLHIAARSNDSAEVVRELIRQGASVDVRSMEGYTPLHLAIAETRSPAVVRALLDGGADVLAEAGEDKITPLSLLGNNSNLTGSDVYWEVLDASYR